MTNTQEDDYNAELALVLGVISHQLETQYRLTIVYDSRLTGRANPYRVVPLDDAPDS